VLRKRRCNYFENEIEVYAMTDAEVGKSELNPREVRESGRGKVS
jgi:hypothetical protein